MATDPLDLDEELDATVLRVRREVTAAGENRASAAGEYISPLQPEEREALMSLLRDGTYRRAAARIAKNDPELADQ